MTRWLYWGTSLLPSRSAGFPHKVVFLASTPCLTSRVSLDSVTVLSTTQTLHALYDGHLRMSKQRYREAGNVSAVPSEAGSLLRISWQLWLLSSHLIPFLYQGEKVTLREFRGKRVSSFLSSNPLSCISPHIIGMFLKHVWNSPFYKSIPLFTL